METFNTIQFYDFNKNVRKRTNEKRVATVTLWKSGTTGAQKYILKFAHTVAQEIYDKGLDGIRLACNTLTGEWFFVFCKGEGLDFKVRMSKDKANRAKEEKDREVTCIEVYSKELTEFLGEKLGLERGFSHLKLSEDLSNQGNMANYKILL